MINIYHNSNFVGYFTHPHSGNNYNWDNPFTFTEDGYSVDPSWNCGSGDWGDCPPVWIYVGWGFQFHQLPLTTPSDSLNDSETKETPTPKATPTPTVKPTPTETPSVTNTYTLTYTITNTLTPTVKVTPTPTVKVTPTPTVKITPTRTLDLCIPGCTDSDAENWFEFAECDDGSCTYETPTITVSPTISPSFSPSPTLTFTISPTTTLHSEDGESPDFTCPLFEVIYTDNSIKSIDVDVHIKPNMRAAANNLCNVLNNWLPAHATPIKLYVTVLDLSDDDDHLGDHVHGLANAIATEYQCFKETYVDDQDFWENSFPSKGDIKVNSAAIDGLLDYFGILRHEILHVLGIGVLWTSHYRNFLATSDDGQDLVYTGSASINSPADIGPEQHSHAVERYAQCLFDSAGIDPDTVRGIPIEKGQDAHFLESPAEWIKFNGV